MEASVDSPVLSVRNLQTVYETRSATVHAVREVSFDLRPGERLGIVGESGSGKSALALSVMGLIEPPGSSGPWQHLHCRGARGRAKGCSTAKS